VVRQEREKRSKKKGVEGKGLQDESLGPGAMFCNPADGPQEAGGRGIEKGRRGEGGGETGRRTQILLFMKLENRKGREKKRAQRKGKREKKRTGLRATASSIRKGEKSENPPSKTEGARKKKREGKKKKKKGGDFGRAISI